VLKIYAVDSSVSVRSLLISLRWEDKFTKFIISLLEEHRFEGKEVKTLFIITFGYGSKVL